MSLYNRVASHPATAWAVLAWALMVTTAVWYGADLLVEKRAHDRFQYQSEEVRAVLLDRMRDYQMALRGGVGLFNASKSVERDEWRKYVERLEIQHVYPGIQGLGFSQMIRPEELARHESAIRAEGFPEYWVRPPGARTEYTAIVYLEPFDWRNRRAFGYDMYSEPVRREAMQRARDSGEMAITGTVKLLQETEQDTQKGFLAYLPVYRNGAPTGNVDQRRAALVGYVYSPFRVKDLMRGILGKHLLGIDFHLFDGDQLNSETQFYEDQPMPGEVSYPVPDALFHRSLRLDVGGRVWTLYLHTLPSYIPGVEATLPPLLGLGGLIASVLLFLYIRTLAGQRRRAEALATEMTADLARHREQLKEQVAARTVELQAAEQRIRLILDSTADGLYGCDIEGRFTFVNPAAHKMLGYGAGELEGRDVHALIHHSRLNGESLPESDCHMHAKLRIGEVYRVEHDVYWCADGQPLHVAAASQPIYQDGAIVGAVVSFSDIHERLEAEAELRRKSEELRAQNDTLQQFNRIMVGRELDMIRLKRQVNELARRLGESPPYDLSFAEAAAPGAPT
jgi:hypothetical protein